MSTPYLYDRYFDFKLFEFFRDRVFTAVNEFRKNESKDDFYKHLFLAPPEFSDKRSFQLRGVVYPYISLWPSSYFDWADKFYSRSVLRRDFSYIDPLTKEQSFCNGFLYDCKKTYRVVAASYFQEFTQQVSQDLLDLDRLRYFDLSCDELLPGLVTRCELQPGPKNSMSSVDESKQERRFTFGAEYTLSVTYPVIDKDKFLQGVELYLNNNRIYSDQVEVI